VFYFRFSSSPFDLFISIDFYVPRFMSLLRWHGFVFLGLTLLAIFSSGFALFAFD